MSVTHNTGEAIIVNDIVYRAGGDLNLDEVIELYRASTLGERRPVNDREAMQAMINHANLTLTAWDGPARAQGRPWRR